MNQGSPAVRMYAGGAIASACVAVAASILSASPAWLALPAAAQTTVAGAWVRATVPQQKASGMFGTITAAKGGRLNAAPFVSPIRDFYLTNPVARASRVMAECSQMFSAAMLEAAE